MASNYFRVTRDYKAHSILLDVFPFEESGIRDAWLEAQVCSDAFRGSRIVLYREPHLRGPWDACGIVGQPRTLGRQAAE